MTSGDRRRRALAVLGWLAATTAHAAPRSRPRDDDDVHPSTVPLRATTYVPPYHAAGAAALVDPVRIAVQCESYGRTKACPDFLLGFVDAIPLLLSSPRAGADVVLHVSSTEVANEDRVFLRFVGALDTTRSVVEQIATVDTRGTDDEQRAQLLQPFVAGLTPYLSTRHPDAITITIGTPAATRTATPATTPWGKALSLSAYGHASGPFKDLSGFGALTLSRVTRKTRLVTQVTGSYGLSLRPPYQNPDGSELSLDTHQWLVSASTFASRDVSRHYAVGGKLGTYGEDPNGQFARVAYAAGAFEWDHYPSDDPRGNQLAIGAELSYLYQRANFRDELGEVTVRYPNGRAFLTASVRKDKVQFSISLYAEAQLDHAARRNSLNASPQISWQLGDHVDLSFGLSATEREVPAPVLPADNYEAQARAAYAQQFDLSGNVAVNLHWDATNGERNNRMVNF